MPNKIVFVCGSPGAGKTTMLKGVADNQNYKFMNVGTVMLEIAIKHGYVKERDEIRFLSKKLINELQILTFTEISKGDGNVILDTHATVEENGRYVPGITIEHTKYLAGLAGFIYIDSLTEDISHRRKGDHTRRREHERKELIDVQRHINLSILSTCATYLDVPVYVIFNEQGKLEESIEAMKIDLKDIFGV
jgi:adenylate kinase